MLEALGKDFQSQHIRQEYRRRMVEKSYRAYVTDALQAMGESIANIAGGGYLKSRWLDVVDDEPEDEDNRSPQEVINHIFGKLKAMSPE